MERGIVFFPEREIYQTPKDVGLSYEDVYFPAADGVRLHGWFVPGERDTLLVWFHGNAGNIADRVDNLGLLVRKTGVSVFLFDYREYGLSQGRVSKAGTFSDAEGVYRYLTEERGVPPEKMVLFGRSLGSALAVYIAATRPVGALIVESAFTSSEDVANLYYPFLKHLVKTTASYRTKELIGQVKAPVLVIHGEVDDIIPLWMGQEVFRAAPEPKEFYLIPGAGHNDTYVVGGDEYFSRLRDFISRWVKD